MNIKHMRWDQITRISGYGIDMLNAREYDIIQKALEYYAMKLQPEEGSKEDAELAYAMFDEMRQNKG